MQLTDLPRSLATRTSMALRSTPLEGPARSLRSAWWAVSGRVPQHERYDRMTVAIIDRVAEPDANYVDVGAHRGVILAAMLRAAPAGRHVAFEPLPGLAARLRVDFPTVDVRAMALSDESGVLEFAHVIDAPAYSGLRARASVPDAMAVETIYVAVSTLDDELDPDVPITMIKIDVEGAELQVLRGATRTLTRWRPVVVFEHGLGGADAYETEPEAVFQVLAACGLKVSRLEDWLAGDAPFTAEEFVDEFRQRRNYVFVAHP